MEIKFPPRVFHHAPQYQPSRSSSSFPRANFPFSDPPESLRC